MEACSSFFSYFPTPTSPGLIFEEGDSSENDGRDSSLTFLPHSAKLGEPCDEHYLPREGVDCAEPRSEPTMLLLQDKSEDLESVKFSPHDAPFLPHKHGSNSENLLGSCSDEQLHADMPPGFVEECNLACVDDLFPSVGHDFSAWDGTHAWSVESLRSIEAAFLSQEEKNRDSVGCSRDDENASQMFAQWLQSSARNFSLSELRKIKLKTSTIESATRQLGGGKKGLMRFLKFVLMWLQSSRPKPSNMQVDEALPMPVDVQTGASLASECLPPPLMNHALRRSSERYAQSLTGSFSPHLMHSTLYPDWMTGARQEQSPRINHSVSPHAHVTNSGSPLHRTEYCCVRNSLLSQAEVYPESSLSALVCTENTGLHTGFERDVNSTMLLKQQQHFGLANPAAATRAARKSRMERQRWSMRHNRKCSASAHQSQHRLSPTASVHQSSSSWSQAIVNGSPSFLHASARHHHQQQTGERSILELPPIYRRSEKNLIHLFEKELKQSDVGTLGRIVLPKKEAETFLPPLELRDGLTLLVEDMNSSKVWTMRYRFWPNNKSRMYLLENTSDFVKLYDLKEGDFMIWFCKRETGKFVIRGAKMPKQAGLPGDAEDDPSILCDDAKKSWSPPQDHASSVL